MRSGAMARIWGERKLAASPARVATLREWASEDCPRQIGVVLQAVPKDVDVFSQAIAVAVVSSDLVPGLLQRPREEVVRGKDGPQVPTGVVSL